jgi:uncharacterized protein (DUF2062 family)
VRAAALRLAASLQCLSGDSIAILLAAGLVLGIFPVYGCPTFLCLLAALVFRLNAPVLQLVNQLSTPLQLTLLVPFARLGERILGSHGTVPNGILCRFSEFTLQAVAGWLCVAGPLGILLFVGLSCALRRRRPASLNQLQSPA